MKWIVIALAIVFLAGIVRVTAIPPGPLPAFPKHPARAAQDGDSCVGAKQAQAFAAIGVQGPGPSPEPPEFPEGESCEQVTQARPNPDHPCACHRQCAGTKEEPTTIEDPRCAQYCHRSKCSCPTECA